MLDGLTIGQAGDDSLNSGVTAILAPGRAVAAVEVRGGAPGTRETDLLAAENTVQAVDGIVLSGGSVFGLAAADGAARALYASGYGLEAAGYRVPILPAAVIFDRPAAAWGGNGKQGGEPAIPDYAALGRRAVESAAPGPAMEGSVGAGRGAVAGGWKGGVGLAQSALEAGPKVAALAVANPWGSVIMPGTNHFWAWWAARPGEPCDQGPPPGQPDFGQDRLTPGLLGGDDASGREATTLAVVATDAALTQAQARRLAVMAGDGVSRAVRPCHSPFDGDITFALSTGEGAPADPFTLAALGAVAADQLARAVMRSVALAQAVRGGPPAWRNA